MSGSEYARGGLIGIGTPQANPTVEAEMRIVLEPWVGMAVVRLTSAAAASSGRLIEYLERLEDMLTQDDSLRPSAFAFACTGSSYLVGRAAEQRIVAQAEERFGYPIVTATCAIAAVLEERGVRRIAIASPYPPTLAEAATAYWREAGYDVAEVRRIEIGSDDTRGIYALGSADARAAVSALRASDVDAVLMSGTGLPSLALVAEASGHVPLLSSNLCLAERASIVAGLPRPSPERWRQRLEQALAPPMDFPT